MKVTLVIYSLGGGGAERVMSILANYWIDHGWDIALILLVPPAEPSFYPLDPRIQVQSLGISGNSENLLAALGNTWQRVKILRRAIMASQPDVVISFMSSINVYTILACWKLNIPTIVSEHIYPTMTDANKIWQRVMKWAYRRADLLTVLTQNALPFYPAASGYRTIVMPNPVLAPSPKVGTERVLVSPSVIAIGRLHPQKGFDLLIKAFHRIQDQCPGWQLTILGEGPLRSQLEDLRDQLQLTSRVHLPGLVTNIPDYLRQADLFVMPSRFEGFPMALCEAMAYGLPVLAADCLSGPRDIIEDGVNGVLVPTEDIDALAAKLLALMSDSTQREKLAHYAPQILDRFGLEQVMALWQSAIDRVIQAHH
jgi:GalNAc-alpha-(1->4)-GalNAc-alpha-(1->3)-diNAcBac-PP-undecaprenol alpha-1,4-N-acetyl-D-galactosaminyltransferase